MIISIASLVLNSLPKSCRERIEKDLQTVFMHLPWTYDDLDDLEVFVILLEDRRFFQHSGFDLHSAIREVVMLLTLRKHGGASTLDMQFVRMRTGYRDRTVRRKVYEIFLAILLQERMDKIQILRAYLSRVYLGSRLDGVNKAAKAVFNKERFELDLSESAFIASMMVYPRPLHPSDNWHAKVERRAAYGIRLHRRLGHEYRQQQP